MNVTDGTLRWGQGGLGQSIPNGLRNLLWMGVTLLALFPIGYLVWTHPAHPIFMNVAALAIIAILLLILYEPITGIWFSLLVVYWNLSNIIHMRLHFGWTLRGLLLWTALAWWLHRRLESQPPPLRWPLWKGWLAYAGVMAVSAAFAAYPSAALLNLDGVAKDIILFYLVVNLLLTPRDWHRGLWALLAAGGLLAMPALYQGITGSHFAFWGLAPQKYAGLYQQSMGYRASGALGDPNFFAMVLIALMPLALVEIERPGSPRRRLLAGVILAMMMGASILTYSRAGFLGLLALGAAFMWHWRRHLRAWLAILAAMLIMAGLTPRSYWLRIFSLHQLSRGMYQTSDPSLEGRRNENLIGLAMLKRHPWLGVGPGNYYMVYRRYDARIGLMPVHGRREAHDLFMETAAETGVLGLAAFLFLLGAAFRNIAATLRQWRRQKHRPGLLWQWSLGLGMGVYLFLSIFLHDAFFRHFVLILALSQLGYSLAREAARPRAPRRPPARIPAPQEQFAIES